MDIPDNISLENYEEIGNKIETASIPTDQELVHACEEDNGYDLEEENPNLIPDIRECPTSLECWIFWQKQNYISSAVLLLILRFVSF